MWYCKWLLLLLYVLHCHSALIFSKYSKGREVLLSRHHHQHHQDVAAHRNRPQSVLDITSTKLRHPADKFPQLKEISKRLHRIAQQREEDATRMRTKHYPAWSDDEDDADDNDADDDGDDDDDDDYIDEEVAGSTMDLDADADDADYKDELVEEDRPMLHNVQAEQSAREPSPITQYKWENYGTRAKVEKIIRHDHGNDNDQMHMMESAFRHRQRVQTHGRCREPRAKVINVQQVHPSPGITFRPHCTILHRCADDTGCCQEAHTRCRAKKQELIHLYFFTMSINPPMSSVKKLAFYNHTECACLAEDIPPDHNHSAQPLRLLRAKSNHYMRDNDLVHDSPPSCKCPEEFLAMSVGGRKCTCDCPTNSDPLSGCMSMKRGREHFSLKNRKCIVEERCGAPRCDFGAYIKSKGRCPRKEECASCAGGSRIHHEEDEEEDEAF